MNIALRTLPPLVFLCVLAQCSLFQARSPFPEYPNARMLVADEREEILRPFAGYFKHEQPESYRFLARARYSEQGKTRKAKQVFVFAPPGRLRVEEYSSVGNHLLFEFVVDHDKARVTDVLNKTEEEFSNVEDVFEYILGVALSPDELLDLFLGRCSGIALQQAEVRQTGNALLVEQRSHSRRILCVIPQDGNSISRFFGSDSDMKLHSTASAFTKENEFFLPQQVSFFSPKMQRSAEFRLEHIGVNKPLGKNLFTTGH